MLFVLISIFCLILQFFLPWWIIAIVSFLLTFFLAKKAIQAFSSSFIALFVLWTVMGLIQSIPNHHLLANRVGQMFMLQEQHFNWIIILFATGLIGGLSAGFSGLAGFYCQQVMRKKDSVNS